MTGDFRIMGSQMSFRKRLTSVLRPRAGFRLFAAVSSGLALTLLALPGQAAGTDNGIFLSTKSSVSAPSGATDLCQRYAWA